MTESALPTNVGTGTVTGKFVTAQKGTSGTPVTVPIVGSVTFTPTPAALLDVGATPPTTILPVPVTATLDAAGSFSVDLVATDDADLNPTGWNYRVSFAFTGTKYASFNINVPEGSTVDLATVAPVASAGGTLITRGIGVPDTSGAATGDVLAVASDGTTHWIAPTGGSGGTVTSDSITDATTVGKALLVAVDAPTARSAIGAASAAQGALANSAVQPTRTVAGHALSADVVIAAADLSDFATAADARIAAAAGTSIASLSGGKIPSSQIPAVALTTVQTAASQAAQLALTTQEGDVVVRTDTSTTWVRNAGTAGTIADFTLLDTPTDAVTSVAGRTGTVTLAKADVGLGSVDNTADSAKPVSTAQAAALALKANTSALAAVATSGSAADLSTGLLAIARLPAQSVIKQAFTSANYASLARPTSRTDVTVLWVGDATTSSSTLPANALAGDPIVTAA